MNLPIFINDALGFSRSEHRKYDGPVFARYRRRLCLGLKASASVLS
jgi:hypothetical protein